MSDEESLIASCHCGAVSLTLPEAPDYLSECNCSLCARIGARWGYYDPAEVAIEGATAAYIRDDMDPPTLALHHCQHCACTTHWTALPGHEKNRIGVNMRLVEDGLLDGIEVRPIDGKRW